MAYIPTNAGWGAAATRKKKAPPPTAAAPKPTKSYDPYGALAGASPQQLAQILFRTQMAGPDYSSVTPPDFNQLQTAALSQAQQSAYRQATPIQDERGYQQARQKVSAEAATNFAKAFSDILTGGKPGAEGEAFSLQNFGGSYLAGMAAQMGQQLISQQQHSFDEQDFRLASKLADIMDAVPEQADKIYQGLADQAVELFKQNKSIADADFKTQIEAIASLIKNKRDDQKGVGGTGKPVVRNFSDGTSRQYNQQTGKWDVVTTKAGGGVDVSTVTQPGGAVVGYDKNTGKVIYTIPGSGKTATGGSGTINGTATGKPISFSAASEYARSMTSNTGTLWKVRKVKGGGYEAYDTGKAKAGVGGSSDSAARLTGAYAVLKGLTPNGRAQKIIDWKETAANTASDAFNGTDKTEPMTYQAAIALLTNHGIPLDIAQSALNRYWRKPGVLMSWEKPGQGRPKKSFQERNPGKGRAARVAASNPLPPPQAIDFNWLAAATTGSTNHSDLGGPSAHYAKHDSGENWQSNNAWDIGMPVGTPIYAATDGVIGSDVGVQASRPDDGQRLTLNGQGNSFWYGHLSKVAVRPGQRVRAGQLIGYSGASANGAAHLHIGVMNIGENRA